MSLFQNLTFQLCGRLRQSQAKVEEQVELHGGKVIKARGKSGCGAPEPNVTHVVCNSVVGYEEFLQKCVAGNVQIVTDGWISSSIEKQAVCVDPQYKLLVAPHAPLLVVQQATPVPQAGAPSAGTSVVSPPTSPVVKKRKTKPDAVQTTSVVLPTVPTVPSSTPITTVPAVQSLLTVPKASSKKTTKGKATASSGMIAPTPVPFAVAQQIPTTAVVSVDAKTQVVSGVGNQQQVITSPVKTVKVTVSSSTDLLIPVDEGVPQSDQYTVHVEGDQIFDAALNQTCIGANNNKYFIIQLLISGTNTSVKKYVVFNRWGRVGNAGQTDHKECGADLGYAKQLFEKKFKDKTGYRWQDRKKQTLEDSKKYVYLEKQYDKVSQVLSPTAGGLTTGPVPAKDSVLDARVQALIRLICNINMMKKQVVDMGLNVEKLPLGKLSKDHIQKGYTILGQLSQALSDGADATRLETLSNHFYTLIPQKYGMSRLPVIDTQEMIKCKLELVQSLEDIRIATALLEATTDQAADANPLDESYHKLRCSISPLPRDSLQWQTIQQYVNKTHNDFYTKYYSIEILDIFCLDREGEQQRYAAHSGDQNRQLLWHSSRLGNFAGILAESLRIQPPTAPVVGTRLGKGVYFTETLAKSSQYCFTDRHNNIGCMLLCEVALGKQQERLYDDCYASELEPGTQSTWGVGNIQHCKAEYVTLPDGVIVPMGKVIRGPTQRTAFEFSERVVYDTSRVKLRYLVQARFIYK